MHKNALSGPENSVSRHRNHQHIRQSQLPYNFFYLAVAVVGAKISFIKSLSIFMKRETLQKRHKQSNKNVFHVVCILICISLKLPDNNYVKVRNYYLFVRTHVLVKIFI